MDNIILGNVLSSHIFILNDELKKSAVSQFNNSGRCAKEYSPWIANGAAVDFDFSDELLKNPPNTKLGGLVIDQGFINHARSYLEKNLSKISHHPGLLPGNNEDWLPTIDDGADAAKLVEASVELILNSNEAYAGLYSSLINYIMPLGKVHRGYSNADTRGVIYRGIPRNWNPFDLAIDIAHELGHHSLFIWQSIDPILSSSPDAPVFSSVRKQGRPAIQSFHGAIALAFMLHLTNGWENSPIGMEAKIRHGKFYFGGTLETALKEAIRTLKENCSFTPVGDKIIKEMEDLLT